MSPGSIDPWPLERQDRHGSGQAVMGLAPGEYSTPWRHLSVGDGYITSHGPSFDRNGTGYFGRWVDNTMRWFDPKTGAILGTIPVGHFAASTPAIGTHRVFVATDNAAGRVFGIAKSGLFIEWLNETGYIYGSVNLGPEGDVAYVRLNGTVVRANESSGAAVWSQTGYGNPGGMVVFSRDNQNVIVSHGNSVTALRWSDGQQVWTYNAGSKTAGAVATPSGEIVFGTESGKVVALNSDGSFKWNRFTANKIDSAPAVGLDGEVYVGSHDWALYAYRVSDGAPLWNYYTNHWINASPVVDANGRIYVQNRWGYIYCLSKTGSLIWVEKVGTDSRGPMTFDGDGTLWVPFADDSGSPVQGGLVSIRQDAPTYPFLFESASDGFTVTDSGTSLEAVDGDVMKIRSAASLPIASNLTAHFDVTLPKREMNSIEIRGTFQLFGVPAVVFLPEVYNHATGKWQSISVRVALSPHSPTSVLLDFYDLPTNAVEPETHKVYVRLIVNRFDRAQSQWGLDIDRLTIQIVPKF